MRVLLVEDDPTTSKSIELMLTHANLNVYATDLGEEGIDLAKLYDYDLILLDLNLPDITGHEVLRQLRVAKVQTPILILSGNDTSADKNTYVKLHGIEGARKEAKQHTLAAIQSTETLGGDNRFLLELIRSMESRIN